jgi:hypothetical protein
VEFRIMPRALKLLVPRNGQSSELKETAKS